MKKYVLILLSFFICFYSSFGLGIGIPKIEVGGGINYLSIRGKLKIKQNKGDLTNIGKSQDTYIYLKFIPSRPSLPYFKIEHFTYRYETKGEVHLSVKDTLKKGDYPFFFGLDDLFLEFADAFGVLDPFGKLLGLDKADLEVKIKTDEYNFAFYYKFFEPFFITPKFGFNFKYLKVHSYRKAKYGTKTYRSTKVSEYFTPMLLFGFDLNFSFFNILLITDVEMRYIFFKDGNYYNFNVTEKLRFFGNPLLERIYLGIGYRRWQEKATLVDGDKTLFQRMKWRGGFMEGGLIF